jgi:lysophospholipase L1-like esterase
MLETLSSSQKNSTGKKALYGLLVFFLFLALTEGALRILQIKPAFANRFFVFNRNYDYPEVFDRDAELLWTLRGPQTIESRFFDKGKYLINSFGMRGTEISPEASLVNIAAVGNSCTFGWQVTEEETYVFRLLDSLNRSFPQTSFQVIDGGIPGYSSYQGKLFYRKTIAPLNPKVTLILFGWNDQWDAADDIIDSEQRTPSRFFLKATRVVNRLRIYRLIRSLILQMIEPELRPTVGQPDSRPRVPLNQYGENLLSIVEQARAIGSSPILLTSPIPSLETYYPPHRRSPMHEAHYRYNRVVREIAFESDIALVDIAAEFNLHNDLFTDVKMDPIHFNARGHKLVAEMLYPAVLQALSDTLQD